MSETVWDRQYATGIGLRWWPEGDLTRFLGSRHWVGQHDPHGLNGQSAIDLGCGTGRNAWALRESGFETHASDASEEALRVARQYLINVRRLDHVFFHYVALPTLRPFQDATVELIVDVQCLQHLAWSVQATAYTEIMRVLKAGGVFFMMTWHDGDSDAIYRGLYPELRQNSARNVTTELEQVGFTIEAMNLVTRSYQSGRYTAEWDVIEAVKR